MEIGLEEYVLNEKNLYGKMDIVRRLAEKGHMFFDKSVVFKTELLNMFLKCEKLDVDTNFILTVSLLCNCKKIDNAQDIEKIHSYARNGAELLRKYGFSNKFCKVCEEINRYSGSEPRENESDILELIDQFGGMLLNRPERTGFLPDEALMLLKERNLKGVENKYLNQFENFVNEVEKVQMEGLTSMSAIRRLVKIHNETEELNRFIAEVAVEYEEEFDKKIMEFNPNRTLFAVKTIKKYIDNIEEANGIKNIGVES